VVIALDDASAYATLLFELERWLEEVDEQSRGGIQPPKRLYGSHAFKSAVADQPPDHRSVLLLDPCLVVLVVRTRPRELYALSGAIVNQGIIQELRSVVDVQTAQQKWQGSAQ